MNRFDPVDLFGSDSEGEDEDHELPNEVFERRSGNDDAHI